MNRTQQFESINQTLQQFQPITLQEMSAVKLMNRIDTKYVVPLPLLAELLQRAVPLYEIQAQGKQRTAAYHTIYLDTDQKQMYNLHQIGRKIRQKIRVRTYLDTNETFLEVKTKNNHGRTKKKRIEVAKFRGSKQYLVFQQNPDYQAFINKKAWVQLTDVNPHVENRFRRITLVNHAKTERLTIDLGITFYNFDTKQTADIGHLAIIELKRDGLTPSPMKQILLQMQIHEGGFSKYCIGCALTNPQLRQNNLKEKLLRIRKLGTWEDPLEVESPKPKSPKPRKKKMKPTQEAEVPTDGKFQYLISFE